MKIQGIEPTSLVNGEGIRVVLWVSGCEHHCKGCQNPGTWNPDDGETLLLKHYYEIEELCEKDYRDGLTLSGGDPMYPGNREGMLSLCKFFREHFGDRKTIWMYTGYTFDEIKDEPILDYLDVIVDGKYIEEQRNITRQWCGSENQRVWRKKEGRWSADEPRYATDTEYESKCGCDS